LNKVGDTNTLPKKDTLSRTRPRCQRRTDKRYEPVETAPVKKDERPTGEERETLGEKMKKKKKNYLPTCFMVCLDARIEF
jgi:hypothetical protein